MDVARIWKLKRPAGWRTWQGYIVARDAWGAWVYSPAGSLFVGQDDSGRQGETEVARDSAGRGRDVLVLVPDDWFILHVLPEGPHLAHGDIGTPPAATPDGWRFDDLELDPVLHSGGHVEIEDRDEFEAAVLAGRIGATEASQAATTAARLAAAMTPGSPLLARAYELLASSTRLGLRPLRDRPAERPPAPTTH